MTNTSGASAGGVRAPRDGKITNTGLGLTEDVMARVDRLRAVYGRSRSWVIELALTCGGLDALERDNADDIRRFADLAARAGQSWQEYAYSYAVLNSNRSYPTTVAELAAAADAERG